MLRPARTAPRLLLPALLALAFLLPGTVLAAQAEEFYWENPRPLVDTEARFPVLLQLDSGPLAIWQESEGGGQQRDGSAAEGRIWLSLARRSGDSWETLRRFAGPFAFRGDVPSIFNAAAEGSRVAIAVATGEGLIEVLLSEDGGQAFKSHASPAPDSASVAPRIFFSASGGYILFATQGVAAGQESTAALSLVWSTSRDGERWEPFAAFENSLKLSFLPVVSRYPGLNLDIAVFQSLVTAPDGGRSSSFQLFSKVSSDGGRTWSPPRRVTDFAGTVGGQTIAADGFNNQGPTLARMGGKVWLAWERSVLGGASAIYISSLGQDGLAVRADWEKVSDSTGNCHAPSFMELGGKPTVTWFDNRLGGNRVYMARKTGTDWTATDLSGNLGESYFGAAARAGTRPYALWESHVAGRYRVYLLEPDTSVKPPSLAALDFTPGQRSRKDEATIRVDIAGDSSGVEGYSWVWSRDATAQPPRSLMAIPGQRSITAQATADGPWYLAVAVKDYAGNWSAAARIRFDRDTTAPPPPLIIPADLDASGFLASSTFSLDWVTPENPDGSIPDDVAGYTWELRYIGGLEPAGGTTAVAAAREERRCRCRPAGPQRLRGKACRGLGHAAPAACPPRHEARGLLPQHRQRLLALLGGRDRRHRQHRRRGDHAPQDRQVPALHGSPPRRGQARRSWHHDDPHPRQGLLRRRLH